MNDLANQSTLLDTEKTAATDTAGGGETKSNPDLADKIAQSMPTVDDGGSTSGFAAPTKSGRGRPAMPDHLRKHPRRRPLNSQKNFGEPSDLGAENISPLAGNEPVLSLEQQQGAPAYSDDDFADAGKGLAEIHADLYVFAAHQAAEPLRTCKEFPKDTLEAIMSRAVAPTRAVENISDGYAAGLKWANKHFGLPPGIVKGGKFVSGSLTLHRTMMAVINELRSAAKEIVAQIEAAKGKL